MEEVELYFNLSEKVRHFTEDYFQLETPLYFSYSHLVCRTSVMGELRLLGKKKTLKVQQCPARRLKGRFKGYLPFEQKFP